MFVRIDEKILEKYPETKIGFLVAEVSIKKRDVYIEALKEHLGEEVEKLGITGLNFVQHPKIALWRNIYQEDFGVKAKQCRSSIEALIRRVVTGKKIWDICNVVDLYNCCSVATLLPIGGYDLNKISGNIEIRFGRSGETFLGLGEKNTVSVTEKQVVYADEDRVLCWLWNHKDAKDSCIGLESKKVIFFIDSFGEGVESALDLLEKHLVKIQCNTRLRGVLNRENPRGQIR